MGVRGSVGSIEGFCKNLGTKFFASNSTCFTDGETEAQEVKFSKVSVLAAEAISLALGLFS